MYRIFYSWQSDTTSSHNRKLIQTGIESAIMQINKDTSFDFELDMATRNSAGSINIADEIFRKISISSVFICDISIINSSTAEFRKTPNPNVLIELGYAISTLGWERIICVHNSDYGKAEDLPFDIRQNRVLLYSSSNKKGLQKTMFEAIETIVKDYDTILKRHNKERYDKHDVNIYDQINNILNESRLQDILKLLDSSQYISRTDLLIFNKIINFAILESNKFLNEKVQYHFDIFINAINEFTSFSATNLFYNSRLPEDIEIQYNKYIDSGEPIPSEFLKEVSNHTFYELPKRPEGFYQISNDYVNEFYQRRDNLIDELMDITHKVMEEYRNFRKELKNEYFI